MPCSIVRLEGRIAAEGGGERIWSITVVKHNTWHQNGELRLVIDAIALEEVSCVVLNASEEEAAQFRADADRVFHEQCRATTHLGSQGCATLIRKFVDSSNDRVADFDFRERTVLHKWNWDRTAGYPGLPQARCVLDVGQEFRIVGEH